MNKNDRFRLNHPLYSKWSNMKRRCLDKTNKCYSLYGGRGISVSKDWLDYKNFERDMLSTYKERLRLERIDNNKGYSRENCKWATDKEQANNRRTNNIIIYKGMTKTLQQWSEYLGIKQSTIAMRLTKYNWSIERCFEGSRNAH